MSDLFKCPHCLWYHAAGEPCPRQAEQNHEGGDDVSETTIHVSADNHRWTIREDGVEVGWYRSHINNARDDMETLRKYTTIQRGDDDDSDD